MSVSELSTSTQNYLKVIWGLMEWSTDAVTPTLIAARTGLRLSSVSDAVRRLADQGMLTHAPYGSVGLTELGRTHALMMVRRHRLLEAFLVSVLGYSWDQVHDEAESLEHAVSDFMIEQIDAHLQFPTRDPHGDPIPAADGTVQMPNAQQLTGLPAGRRYLIERISDADPALLQFFAARGITVGASLTIGDGAPYSDSLDVQVEGATQIVPLGRSATEALFVSTLEG